MRRKSLFILIAILLLGLFLRIYRISSNSLYGDELTIGYDSYSLLKTGMDQTGERYPLTFKMGAGRPPGYVYFSMPFISLFGLNEVGVRSLSAISGLGIIVLMYFLGKKLFSEKIGLYASFLTSISMWDIYLSRGGFEAHFALFLSLLGIVFFLYKKYIPMALFWGLAIFTYPTYKLTLLLVFLALLLLYKSIKILRNKKFILAIIILGVFASFSLYETFNSVSDERFLSINIFSDKNLKEHIIQNINEERTLSNLPEIIKPVMYNRPFRYSRLAFEKYIENLSPSFLYLRGDGNPRHNPGEWGMFYLAEGLLFAIGLYLLIKGGETNLKPLVFWILIVPLATMFLGQTHALRNNFMIPPFILIESYALSRVSKKTFYIIMSILLMQLVFVLLRVYFYAPYKFGSFWSSEAKYVSNIAIKERDNYEKIILSSKIDSVEYAYPVYAKLDPNVVISEYGKFPKEYGNVVITDDLKGFKDDDKILILE